MTGNERAQLADLLSQAYVTRQPIDPPSAGTTLSLDDAYAVQSIQVEKWKATGARVRGHKVGITSRAMQKALGIEQPDYGHLVDSMFVPAGEKAKIARFIQVRVEPEIAFVLGRDLRGPGVTTADALAAIDFGLAALELIDSRIRDWKITLVDTIADNASSGAVVLGSKPVPVGAADLRLLGCNFYKNGSLVATGAGGAVLGDPVRAVAWLANTLGSRGVTLEAGQVVMSGSCTAPVAAAAGDTVRAEFALLGSVSISFDTEGGT